MTGDAKWDSEELALLASFISEGHSLVGELFSGPVVVQLLKLMPTRRGQCLASDCESNPSHRPQKAEWPPSDSEAVPSSHDGAG